MHIHAKNNDVCDKSRTPANAQQCAVLFPQKNSNIKNQIADANDSEILKYMDALVIEHLKISTSNQHGIDRSLKQALETVEKNLKEIFQKDPKYREIYKLKFTEKSKEYSQNSKNKDKEKRKEDKEKREIIEASLDPINQAKQKIIFHQIKPGKFMMGEIRLAVEVMIDEPFSMMSTQFTQMMWARLQIAMGETDLNKINPSYNKTNIMKLNPSKYKTGNAPRVIKIENFDVEMKPDHPVEQVSWDDVTEFIIKLNDLSKSNETKIQNLLINLIPDHQKNDVYDLPTDKQWEFVMRDRGNANKKFFDIPDESKLSKFAWYYENSGNETNAVAQLLPRMIDTGYGIRKPFYDMEGNVWEWNKNLYDSSARVIRGGGFGGGANNLRSGIRVGGSSYLRSDAVGFRLARTNR